MSRRIALIPSSYHPYVGGVEEHVRKVALELVRRGHDVEVWTVHRGEHLSEQVVDGIPVRYLGSSLPTASPRGLAGFLRHLPHDAGDWMDAHRRFGPDVLHVQCFGPNGLYAAVLQAIMRTPFVVSAHGETFADAHNVFEKSFLLRRGLQRASAVAEAVTGVSSIVVRDLEERFGAKGVKVVPNGVDVPTEVDLVDGRDSGAQIVLAVGRVERVKGFDLLVRAFALPEVPTTAQLVIAGDGGYLGNLEALVDELGLGDRVTLPGMQSSEQVQHWMARADVVAVPSRREAFGIVALEAWAAGTPLVATSLGGPVGFVRDGIDGLLVDPRDAAALASALGRVLGEPQLAKRISVAGRERVKEFTWAKVVDEYEAIYEQVVSHRRSTRAS